MNSAGTSSTAASFSSVTVEVLRLPASTIPKNVEVVPIRRATSGRDRFRRALKSAMTFPSRFELRAIKVPLVHQVLHQCRDPGENLKRPANDRSLPRAGL